MAFVCGGPARAENPPSFFDGEELRYAIYWELAPAGEATLVSRETEGGWLFELRVRTNAFVDFFYKVRDHVTSEVAGPADKSLRYVKDQREGDYRRHYTIIYDWDEYEARRYRSGELRDVVGLLPGAVDPLSVFYRFRTMDLAMGASLMTPVSDGKKMVLGEARVIRRETIDTDAGEFDTFVVEPVIKDLGGVFKKSDDASLHIWVTADSRKLPVRIKSKVVVGSFYADLKEVPEQPPR